MKTDRVKKETLEERYNRLEKAVKDLAQEIDIVKVTSCLQIYLWVLVLIRTDTMLATTTWDVYIITWMTERVVTHHQHPVIHSCRPMRVTKVMETKCCYQQPRWCRNSTSFRGNCRVSGWRKSSLKMIHRGSITGGKIIFVGIIVIAILFINHQYNCGYSIL